MIYLHQKYMADNTLRNIYNDMVAEGAYAKMFNEGELATAQAWVEHIRENAWLVAMGDDQCRPFAVFWLDNFIGSVAMFHYFAYRCAWGQITDEVLTDLFNWLRENIGGKVCNLVGYTPKKNRLAVRMLKRAGFEIGFELEDNEGNVDVISYRRI